MRVEGFASDELVDAGLAHRSAQGRVTDFYRQRVLIPIRDQQERLCGFVAVSYTHLDVYKRQS